MTSTSQTYTEVLDDLKRRIENLEKTTATKAEVHDIKRELIRLEKAGEDRKRDLSLVQKLLQDVLTRVAVLEHLETGMNELKATIGNSNEKTSEAYKAASNAHSKADITMKMTLLILVAIVTISFAVIQKVLIP